VTGIPRADGAGLRFLSLRYAPFRISSPGARSLAPERSTRNSRNTAATEEAFVGESIKALLGEAVDYAGLFPPAGLDMAASARNFARYASGAAAWALGRFIVPVSRLEEFNFAIADVAAKDGGQPWRLSALAGSDPSADLERIKLFNRWHGERDARLRTVIDTVEIKAATPELVSQASRELDESLRVFFEIPIERNPADLVAAIAKTRRSAKVRTGGVTREAIPTARDLARFLDAALREGISFKATAGLHHPIRGSWPLTYERNAPRSTMHGFLNLFLCAAFMYDGMDREEAERLLAEEDVAAFRFDDGGAEWKGRRVSADGIAEARRRFAVSFGSCSFEEPLDDLRELGLL
jgi:hypothetical protein